MKNRLLKIILAAAILSLAAACAGQEPPPSPVETVVIEVEGEQVVITATPEAAGVANLDPEQRVWLEAAGLGPFTPVEQDWDAIEAAAREEGKVVIYSVSSRIFNLQEEFMEKYGVEIEAYDLASEIQLEKLHREHDAGIYAVDVIFNNDAPTIISEFLPRGLIWNFVPDMLVDDLDPIEMEPMLTQRWSSRVLFYNTAAYPDGSPVDNLWRFR
jgi:spermidine/putrescine-binding protein